jgi:hypothetical protein
MSADIAAWPCPNTLFVLLLTIAESIAALYVLVTPVNFPVANPLVS